MKPQEILEGKSSQWIFGYGSLVWKPDFVYQRRQIGYVEGYKRRFWHGDDFYRGDKKNPGRVVTLIEDQEACTWGVAYEVTDAEINEAFQYLNVREVVLGGYITKTVEFIPQEKGKDSHPAIVYIATANSPTYLGPASHQEIADKIVACRGKTGHNMEYLFRLADFMRLSCPEVEDEHLFSIEAAVLNVYHNCAVQNSLLSKSV
ncbi:glutathione-specific gamma-glutamylcyclotransferase 1-like isoform X1 [Nerophis ophidion]|uniref:glutathione-specific gamma-glutamylcyclotransferase 1-like isoform X1 n=1 Tax=Nerophis ophidion TaxID=159077 RepID=UPI002ADEFEAF|nr:glutathione-specific gamma-glutamylcyclotransferase 1-like isoform X1 [Nerophis ophidion]